MLKISSFLLFLFLASCASTRPPSITLDVSNCDPRERTDCVSLKTELLEDMNTIIDENQRLRGALTFCQKKI